MASVFAWMIKGGWPAFLAAIIAGLIAYEVGHWRGYAAGYAAHDAEVSQRTREKLNDAIGADDAHRSRLNDPAYRLQDDGFKRRE